MTTNYHTAIATGAAANASTFNTALGALDSGLTNTSTIASATTAEVMAARAAYASLDARLDDLVLAGGNVATKASGASVAGQKVLTVDSTTGFIVGAYVTYLLNGATLEGNTIASINAGVSLVLGTNIGTGGVLDDTYISMISISEYLAAQAIPHAGTLTLPQAMEYAAGGVFNAAAYGASPSASAAVNAAAIQAAIDDAGAGVVLLPDYGTYEFDTCLDMTAKRTGATLRGAHTYGTFLSYTGTGGNCIDLTHSAYARIENITLTVKAGATPEVGILMGRNASGDSAGNHRLTNVIVQGAYSKAAVYSCSSEVNHFDNLHIYQNAASSYGYYHSDTNDLSVASAYETLTALAANATVATFIGGSVNHWHASGGEAMHFKNITNLSIHGTSMHTSGTPAVGTITLEGIINSAVLSGIRQEGTPSYGIHVLGTLAASVVNGCYLSGTVAGTYGANGSTIQNSSFEGIAVAGTTMQINAATMNNCMYNLNTLAGTVRTAALNNIWYNCAEDGNAFPLTLTGGIGNICFSQWAAGNPRWVINKGGVFASDMGWGIKGAADATGQAVGALAKKVAIYDEAGNIIGYVPIYAAFTGP